MSKEALKRAFLTGVAVGSMTPKANPAYYNDEFAAWYTAELDKMREPDNAAMIDAKRPVRELGLTQFAIDRQRREEHRKTRRSIIGDNDGPWEITDE